MAYENNSENHDTEFASTYEQEPASDNAASGFRPVSVGSKNGLGAHGLPLDSRGPAQGSAYGSLYKSVKHTSDEEPEFFWGNGPADVQEEEGQSSEHRRKYRRRSKRHSKKRRKTIIAICCFVLGVVVVAGSAAALFLKSLNDSLGFQDKEEANRVADVLYTPPKPVAGADSDAQAPFYILLMGSDSRDNLATADRSDVLMLCRVDLDNATVHLISIPRDMMVDIQGRGTNKINAAHAYGGAALSISMVSEFAGVPISHYAEISFQGLEDLVDGIGGVYVTVPESFQVGQYYFSAGDQWLDGSQALLFARERYNVTGGDFGRAQAQRLVVEAIINQVLSLPAGRIPGVVQDLADSVTTDMSVSDIADMALALQGKELTIYSCAVPSYAYNMDGISYVCPMFNEFRDMMMRVDAGMDPQNTDAAIPQEQLDNSALGTAPNSPAPQDYYDLTGGLNYTDVIDPETGKPMAESGSGLAAA